MTTNVTVKTRFRVNGQEYASVDDMPAPVRQAFERAMASMQSSTQRGLLPGSGASTTTHVHSTISFNGQQFASTDAMPTAMRKVYDDVMAALDLERSAD